MNDKHGRAINYLRVSVTDRCNLRCVYCMPEEGIKKLNHSDILRFEEIIKIVSCASLLGVSKVRYTGGEPLLLPGIEKLIYETSKLEAIKDISITTNGILLGDVVKDLKKAGLNRVNISLDTLDKEKFKDITRIGELEKVISAIEKCISLNLSPVKINVVLMKDVNYNEVRDLMRLTMFMPVEVRFIELMPIGEGIDIFERNKIGLDEIIHDNPYLIPIESQKSSTAQLYKLKGSIGQIGFISPMSCKFCADCNKIRLTSVGTIKPCLHSKDEINLKQYLDSEELLTAYLKAAILNKPLEHHLEDDKSSESLKMMYQIGG